MDPTIRQVWPGRSYLGVQTLCSVGRGLLCTSGERTLVFAALPALQRNQERQGARLWAARGLQQPARGSWGHQAGVQY